jgi:LysR family nitrogen assimilation transcriptional regulator
LDIRQIRYFIKIVECGSLSKAAEQLYIAQPSLTLQVQYLETEFDTKLLIRSSQGVKPTEAGKRFYQQARAIIRQLENISQEIKSGIGIETGSVVVGFPAPIALVLARPLFVRVQSKFPNIHLHIVENITGYLLELLVNGRLDLAVTVRDVEARGMSVQPLFDQDLYVYGNTGSALPENDICPMRELHGIPMVLPSAFQESRLRINRVFAQAGVDLNVIADIDSVSTLLSIAEAGLACTILPLSVASRCKKQKQRFRPRRIVNPDIQQTVSLCWPTQIPPSSASIAVHRTIIELVQELVKDDTIRGFRLRPVNHNVKES